MQPEKDERVVVRVDSASKRRYERLARNAGVNLSEFIRRLLDAEVAEKKASRTKRKKVTCK